MGLVPTFLIQTSNKKTGLNMTTPTHVLLIDGNSIAHACNSISVMKTGAMETQAIFGFLRTLKSLVGSSKHERVVAYILWDGRAQFRYDLWPEYKANRLAKTQEEEESKQRFRNQLPFLYAAVSSLGVKQFRSAKHEADDLAGHFVRALNAAGVTVTMVSGDQDWIGLVTELTDWYDPIRDRRVDHFSFAESTGTTGPKSYYHSKALKGDTSDNIPGMPRIGEGGTAKFIAQWENVDNYLAAVDAGEYTPKKAGKTAKNPHYEDFLASPEGRAMFARNLELMDLSRPLPPGSIPSMADLRFADNGKGANPEGFLKLCERLSFFTILKTVDAYLATFGLVNPRTQSQPEAIPA